MTSLDFREHKFSINTEAKFRGEWVGITEVDFREEWIGLKNGYYIRIEEIDDLR